MGEQFDPLDLITIPDWITPLMQLVNEFTGMIYCYGSAAEIKALRKAGIRCHAPMLDHLTGLYQWQIDSGDYDRAMKITGG